jgi:hypothetical protein
MGWRVGLVSRGSQDRILVDENFLLVWMLIFWVYTPRILEVLTNVSEEFTACIFKVSFKGTHCVHFLL